jgi:shikimate kinase
VNLDLDRPIALIGLMGAGKSAVARILGERLGTAVADLDAMLEAEEGLSIAELFARSGEAWFRRRESELLERAIAAGALVLACGGGVVLDPRHREALRARCHVVWLEVTPTEAARRVKSDGDTRPLLRGADEVAELERLLAARATLYAEAASLRIATDGRTEAQVAGAVIDAVRAVIRGPRS